MISASSPLTWNRWVSIQFYCFHCPTIFSSLGSLILGEQIVHIDEFEDKLALSNNKPNFNLPESPFFFSTIQFFGFTFLFWFSFQQENHHHSLKNHIFIVFSGPPPPSLHYYCFPTTTTFLFFPSSSTTINAATKFLAFFHPHLPISIAFLLFLLLHHHHHHHIPMLISTTITTFRCLF